MPLLDGVRKRKHALAHAIASNRGVQLVRSKLNVVFIFALLIYMYYVYVDKFAIPMLRPQAQVRLGHKAEGIVFLVGFNFLFLMFLLCYIRTLFTPPGFAEDYKDELEPVEGANEDANVPDGDRNAHDSPVPDEAQSHNNSALDEFLEALSRGPDGADGNSTCSHNAIASNKSRTSDRTSSDAGTGHESPERDQSPSRGRRGVTSRPDQHGTPPYPGQQNVPSHPDQHGTAPYSDHGGVSSHPDLGSVPPHPDQHGTPPHAIPPTSLNGTRNDEEKAIPDDAHREAFSLPVLRKSWRYDRTAHLIKPYRAHRCRRCERVVLKMDHHCPWLGQCVGAYNYKFYYQTVAWACWMCWFTSLTLLFGNAFRIWQDPHANFVDGNQIAVLATAFVTGVFLVQLFAMHTSFIQRNLSTIEHLSMRTVRHQDHIVLRLRYGRFNFGKKLQTYKKWDRDWGRLGKEANLWWLGSAYANWVAVMGTNPLNWIFPLSNCVQNKGLTYPTNPRFSIYGAWLRRCDWPAQFQ